MKYPLRISAAILLIAATFMVGRWTGRAEAMSQPQPSQTVLSGNDIGFRVERHKGTAPVGRLVVRVDGQWVEPEFSVGVRPATR